MFKGSQGSGVRGEGLRIRGVGTSGIGFMRSPRLRIVGGYIGSTRAL